MEHVAALAKRSVLHVFEATVSHMCHRGGSTITFSVRIFSGIITLDIQIPTDKSQTLPCQVFGCYRVPGITWSFSTPPGLVLCGDSCFPGIGVPAVAGSGLLAAHATGLQTLEPTLGEMSLDGFSMVNVVVSINFSNFNTLKFGEDKSNLIWSYIFSDGWQKPPFIGNLLLHLRQKMKSRKNRSLGLVVVPRSPVTLLVEFEFSLYIGSKTALWNHVMMSPGSFWRVYPGS